MKHTNRILLAAAALLLAGAPTLSFAHCGACGVEADHSHDTGHAEAAKTLAIYPLAQEAGFNTLTAALQAAGLDGVLSGEGPFTVFAPTDEAFAKLPAGTVEQLLANPEQLKQILLYHVVSGNVLAADVVQLDSAKTLNGALVAIDTADGVRVNDARVIQTDISASNGTVHVIDTVLIPGTN